MKEFLKFSTILVSLLYCSAALAQPLGQGNGPGPLPPSVLLGQANTWSAAQTFSSLGTFNSGLLAPQINIGSTGTGSIAVTNIGTYCWTASSSSTAACDTGFTRDSVLGATNVDLGTGAANDKTGTLNATKIVLNGCTIGTNSLCANGNIIGSIVGASSGGQLRFYGNGTSMLSPSDGVMTMVDNSGASFARLQLGGTTASYPSIKRNATAVNFRLADDSADAPLTAASITNSGALIAAGSAPTGSGTCTRGAQTGGNTTGTIVLTCTAQTLILTFSTTAPTGWMCEAFDQTTTADTMKQTSNTTTSCTLTGTTAASDVVLFQARAY